MSEEKNSGIFDFKENMKGVIAIIVLITTGGWLFGYNWSDVDDVARSVITIAKPDLPISVAYRESILGKGYVAIIQNDLNSKITIEITLRDHASNNKKSQTIEFLPNQMQEIGWMEGWEFSLGDVIRVSHPEYQVGVYEI